MDGADIFINKLALFIKSLASHAIPALIERFVYIASIVYGLEQFLSARLVPIAAGADKLVMGDIQPLPEGHELGRYIIAVFLLWHALVCRYALDILTMFVGSGQKIDIIAIGAMITSHYVSRYGAVGMSDVRNIISVIYGRRNIEFTHSQFPPVLLLRFGLRLCS